MAVNAVNQQKELGRSAEKKFVCTFEKHTVKLAAATKLQEDNQKSLSPHLPTSLFELNFGLFLNSNSGKQKMIGCEAAKESEGNKVQK